MHCAPAVSLPVSGLLPTFLPVSNSIISFQLLQINEIWFMIRRELRTDIFQYKYEINFLNSHFRVGLFSDPVSSDSVDPFCWSNRQSRLFSGGHSSLGLQTSTFLRSLPHRRLRSLSDSRYLSRAQSLPYAIRLLKMIRIIDSWPFMNGILCNSSVARSKLRILFMRLIL